MTQTIQEIAKDLKQNPDIHVKLDVPNAGEVIKHVCLQAMARCH